MKVGIYVNPSKDKDNLVTEELHKLFRERQIETALLKREFCGECDVIAVLGGDGTILGIAERAAKNNIPVVGFNLGELGFLSEFEKDELEEAVDLIRNGDLVRDERSLLEVCLDGKTFLALNDAVLQRVYKKGKAARVVKLRAYLDGNLVDNFVSDGLIASTPTGSTAYYLSSGGNILTPHLNAFAISPICAHSLHNKPIVYSDSSELKIQILENGDSAALFTDGDKSMDLYDGAEVIIKKSEYSLSFLRRRDWNFYKILLQKLNKWSTI